MKIQCHCGNIVVETDHQPVELTSCNCSICHRYQALWGYYPPDNVRVEIGGSGSSSYLWNDRCIEFVHCNECGCVTHYQSLPGDASPVVAVNFRMAPRDEVAEIPVRHFNGADM